MSQANFMRNVRMTLPQYVTNITSFKDTVRILKNKSILNELGPAAIQAAGNPEEEAEYKSTLIRKKSPEDDEEEIQALIDKYAEEESGKYTTGGEQFEISEDEDGYPEDYEDPDMFDAYGMDASEGKINEKNLDVDPDQLKLGIKTEMEHTSDPKVAEEIALDHLAEDPHYYSKLKQAGLEEIKEAKERKGSSGKEQYSKFSEAENDNLQELTTGINIEHECFPEKTYEEIEKIVLKNIKKNPNYYTDFKLTGIRDYHPQTMDASKPESHQMKFVKGEDSYVDKERGMKPVKGVEKAKASSNKAHKEINKIVKGVEEFTHIAKTVRGITKFEPTGGKMKLVRIMQEAKFNAMPGEEPNTTVKHAINFIQSNPVLRQISDDITLQNDGENAVLKYGYWEALSDEAYNKLELQFFVEDDFEGSDEDGNDFETSGGTQSKIAYILYPKKKAGNLGTSLEMGASKASKMDAFKESLEKLVREVLDEMYDGYDNLNRNEY